MMLDSMGSISLSSSSSSLSPTLSSHHSRHFVCRLNHQYQFLHHHHYPPSSSTPSSISSTSSSSSSSLSPTLSSHHISTLMSSIIIIINNNHQCYFVSSVTNNEYLRTRHRIVPSHSPSLCTLKITVLSPRTLLYASLINNRLNRALILPLSSSIC